MLRNLTFLSPSNYFIHIPKTGLCNYNKKKNLKLNVYNAEAVIIVYNTGFKNKISVGWLNRANNPENGAT